MSQMRARAALLHAVRPLRHGGAVGVHAADSRAALPQGRAERVHLLRDPDVERARDHLQQPGGDGASERPAAGLRETIQEMNKLDKAAGPRQKAAWPCATGLLLLAAVAMAALGPKDGRDLPPADLNRVQV